ncbi:MAG TPA: hypothetical protein PLM70_01800, partial [Bacteroidales bacterium]|nr:hypothetical protein [Bacteroidales bacterium]
MYYFELPESSISEAIHANLKLVEEICEEYSLENYFGTISTATQEFLSVIKKTTKGEDVSVIIGYILENDQLLAHFEINGTIITLPTLFEEGKELNPIKMITLLIDEIQYTENQKGISFGFHVKQEA